MFRFLFFSFLFCCECTLFSSSSPPWHTLCGKNHLCLSPHPVLIFKHSISRIPRLKKCIATWWKGYDAWCVGIERKSLVKAVEFSIRSRVMVNKLAPHRCNLFVSCLFRSWSGIARSFTTIWFVFLYLLFTRPSLWLLSPSSSTLLKGHHGTLGNPGHHLDKLRLQLSGSTVLFVLPSSLLCLTSIAFSALVQRMQDDCFHPLCKIIKTTTTTISPLSRER